ncbi:PREDICTED: probable LRR receptor-like serine/threonine-protein kinase At5g37450 [Tarenaya hassleriana]|uniref:probable LRR receptor-like serine/threonine-protein kinase At5g37450 n=1 Tax=Tarenaya hassleriana TaxID=28532 RepID=UPI0008FD83E3|nr:PREDICTED: probable LRR receptor-like serine/threonine-protein kinase At5g37450 [Tarenaya hassleriana]
MWHGLQEKRKMVGARMLILVVSWCSLSLLNAQQMTHPLDVSALRAARRGLGDPMNNLGDWKNTDPCSSNWTGVFCFSDPSDGYLHVQELRLLNMNLSGRLAPELGYLSNLTILNFMWNNLGDHVPAQIGNLTHLKFLLLSGNKLSGRLPEELGSLSSLLIFQVDYNNISGELPKSLANLTKLKHFHMNNNSISGQIPPEYSALSDLLHFLMDNNNLSGYLPSEMSQMRSLKILQLDNNNFVGNGIPSSYGSIPNLLKLSLRNCNLQGPVPDLSKAPFLYYLDLSSNKLTGNIPTNRFSGNITTIDLSNNMLDGSIPSNFSGLPRLQRLSLQSNMLSGEIPLLWQNRIFDAEAKLILDLRNNFLSNVSSGLLLSPPPNVTIKLYGNPICSRANESNIGNLCGISNIEIEKPPGGSSNDDCKRQSCPKDDNYEYVVGSPFPCFCALPIHVGLRLRSPSFSDFRPYLLPYLIDLAPKLGLHLYQLFISSFTWQVGPRLVINLTIFPEYSDFTNRFNFSELHRLVDFVATFSLSSNDAYGPYEILYISLLGPYKNSSYPIKTIKSGMSKGAKVGAALGAISLFLALSSVVSLLVMKARRKGKAKEASKKQPIAKSPINMESVKGFNFEELEAATSSFNDGSQIGRGGYGNVYKGLLPDGTIVAIKRAQQGSLQGQKEFYTEIELLSRLHHRNLVSLLGYCDEEGEQMLVYEFMPNGSLQDALSARFRQPLSFGMRLHIAMCSARGILYLHTEADPPIIHRDIKPSNILLDAKFNPKVSDFGISKLVPAPDGAGVRRDHVTTVVKGTPGYVDPEYFLSHKLTEKSDVYSLGIVFLEILTGMRPISHGRNIVREVREACESGMMMSIIDRSMGRYTWECGKRFMELALKCCQDKPEARPTMLEIVRELENLYVMLPDLEKSDSSSPIQSNISFSEFTGSELVSGVIPSIRPR